MGYRSFIGTLAVAATACGCGGSSGGSGTDGGVMPDPQLVLDGEYLISVETVDDDCGFGAGDSSTPILVVDTGESSASVNIPLGGAGGSCAPGPFSRMDNLLSRTLFLSQTIGSCNVEAETTTTLEFFAGGGVEGAEFNTLTPVSGDCSLFGGACTVELRLTGDRCADCFSCEDPRAPLGQGDGAAFGSFGLGVWTSPVTARR